MDNIIKSPIISMDVYDARAPRHNLLKVKERPFYALTYRKSGSAKFHIAGKTFVSKRNCVTFTPKNQSYLTEITEDTHIIAIQFDCLENQAFQTPFVFKNTNDHIQELFEMISKKYSAKENYNYKCFSLFYELLDEIEKYFINNNENKINPKILKAKKEIDKCFCDNDFNIEKLTSLLDLSPSYLRREFKKAYLVSPISYLKTVRLQKAMSMLLSDYYSIEDIAKKCGYGSASYFIQVFHKSKGCSPLKYKEMFL